MKIAIVGDTHWGVRNESKAFLRQAEEWSRGFFRYLNENDIKHIFHLGDLVDRRKYINFLVASSIRKYWVAPIIKNGIKAYHITGNHDVYFTNTNYVNALKELLPWWRKEHFEIFDTTPDIVELDNIRFAMIPWICTDNEKNVAEFIENVPCTYACAHLELKGFDFYRGQTAEHGLDHSVFGAYHRVWTGHYHTQSTRDNIHYVGAPYEMVWSDYDDPRGFWVFDTETHETEFVQNTQRMFHKVHVTDQNYAFDPGSYADKIVKLIVPPGADPVVVEKLTSSIESELPADIQVVDDHLNMDILDEVEISDNIGDTLDLLRECVSQLDTAEVDKDELTALLTELYSEAQTTRV
jgi:DNA repair exonuclease SbcCD nuclease subunit